VLLVIDIGNTNIVLGVYDKDRLRGNWRLGTNKGRTSDEYGILIKEILSFSDIECEKISDAIISSVVPPLESTIVQMATKYFNLEPLIVETLVDRQRFYGADYGCCATLHRA